MLKKKDNNSKGATSQRAAAKKRDCAFRIFSGYEKRRLTSRKGTKRYEKVRKGTKRYENIRNVFFFKKKEQQQQEKDIIKCLKRTTPAKCCTPEMAFPEMVFPEMAFPKKIILVLLFGKREKGENLVPRKGSSGKRESFRGKKVSHLIVNPLLSSHCKPASRLFSGDEKSLPFISL